VERKSILIVDDDKEILKSLRSILQSKGYDVDTVETGEEALEKSRAKFFHLVLLDIRLPDIEGTKLLKTMHRTLPKMMKIMLTGFASLDNAIEALNLGADAYLMKPIDPAKLLSVVEEKLKEQEQADRMTEEKVAEWIETRVRKLESKQGKR